MFCLTLTMENRSHGLRQTFIILESNALILMKHTLEHRFYKIVCGNLKA